MRRPYDQERPYPDTCGDPQTWRELFRDCDPIGLAILVLFVVATVVSAFLGLLV